MGTRAQFFIGNPEDIGGRRWLGCVAWDGYPEGDIGKALNGANDEARFLAAVAAIAAKRDDFGDPAKMSFPFPWKDDLFLTDCTYALFDGRVQFTSFHRGWIDLKVYLSDEAARDNYYDGAEQLPKNVVAPAGLAGGPPAPDSIMVMRVPK